MFRVMVFDKNTFALQGLADTISNVSGKFDVEYFSGEENAFEFAMTEKIDLFVVRIYPVRNDAGYDFVKRLRTTKAYEVAFVILLTSMDDEAMHSALYDELNCYRIFSDPIDPNEFKQVLSTVSNYRIVRNDDIEVPFYVDGGHEPVKIAETMWIGSGDGLSSLYMVNGNILNLSIRKYSLDVLESMLEEDFVRIKRTILVNKRYIENVDYKKSLVKLKGIEEAFRIGVTYASRVKLQLSPSL